MLALSRKKIYGLNNLPTKCCQLQILKSRNFGEVALENNQNSVDVVDKPSLSLDNFDAQILINILSSPYSRQKQDQINQLRNSTNQTKLIRVFFDMGDDDLDQLNPTQTSEALRSIVSLRGRNEHFNQLLFQQFCSQIDGASSSEVSATVWGAGKLNIKLTQTQKELISSEILSRLDKFNSFDLSNLFVGLKDLKWDEDLLLSSLASAFVKLLDDQNQFSNQIKTSHLSLILHACACLHFYHEQMVDMIVQLSIEKIQQFKGQDITNLLSAISNFWQKQNRRPRKVDELYEVSAHHIIDIIDNIVPQNLPNILMSYTLMKVPVLQLSKTITPKITENASRMSMSQISDSLWSSATILKNKLSKRFDVEMVRVLMPCILKRTQDMTPQNVSITLQALATLEQYSFDVVNLFCQYVCRHIQNYEPRHITNTIWALGSLGHFDEVTMRCLCSKMVETLPDFKPYQLCSCIYSLAVIDYKDEQLLSYSLKYLTDYNLEKLQNRQLCNLVWALALLEVRDEKILSQIISKLNEFDVAEFSIPGLSQLFMSKILLDGSRKSSGDDNNNIDQSNNNNNHRLSKNGLWDHFNQALLSEAEETWKQSQKHYKPTTLHKDVFATVRKIFPVNTYREQIAEEGLFRIDVAVIKNQMKIAFEADGPMHFMRNKPERQTGTVVARQKIMKQRGWEVVQIPFFEWDPLHEEERRGYIDQKLLELGISGIDGQDRFDY